MQEDLSGHNLDRYLIIRRLGEDHLGVVYKAHDPTLERDVAIRVIHTALARQPGFSERFAEAARTAARLDHPNLVQVFDFGEARGYRYLVREFLPGDDLKKLFDRLRAEGNWILLPEAVQLIRQLALVLEYLRSQGAPVLYVQPAEILIKPLHSEGLPYIPVIIGPTLLGLEPGPQAAAAPGVGYPAMAAPAYLSPEVSLGRPGDARSEVYSLGVLLFELCTGQPPFPIQNAEEAVRYHTRQPVPPPRAVRPDLPESLERVIIRALEKNPAGRFDSPVMLSQELDQLYPQLSRIQTPPSAFVKAVSLLEPYRESLEEPLPAAFENTIPPTQAVTRPAEEQRQELGLWADNPHLAVEPGSSVSTVLTLENTGTVAGIFRLSVEGVPPEWVSIAPPVLSLAPGERKGATVSILPPRQPGSRAGRYPLTFRATDQRRPGWSETFKATLTVGVYYEFTSRLYTTRLASGETGQVAVNNRGNTQETFNLFLRDPSGDVVFTPPQATLRLREGQAGALEFRADPAHTRWIGSDRMLPFNAQVVSSVGETQTHSGEFVSKPVLPAWVIGIFLLTLLCSASVLTLVLSRQGREVSSATQTARAEGTALAAAFTATSESGTATAEFLENANQATLEAITATASWLMADDDEDGLLNGQEIEIGTRVDEADTDRDGLGDGDEVNNRRTDPLRPDTDGDGLSDGSEVAAGLDPLNPDTDGDGLTDSQDPSPLHTSTPTTDAAATTALISTQQAATQQAIAAQTAAAGTAAAGTAAAGAGQTAAAGTALAQASQTAAAQTEAANNNATAAVQTSSAAATLTAQAGTGGPPRLLFVYGTFTTDTQDFLSFLRDEGDFQVTEVIQGDLPVNVDFSRYVAILVSPETEWNNNRNPDSGEQAAAILQSNLPVFGLGRGGANLFNRLNLAIGMPDIDLPSGSEVVVIDPGNPVWTTPNPIQIPGNNTLALYSTPSPVAAPASPQGSPNPQPIASLAGDSTRIPLVRQDRFLLWGFSGRPGTMTDAGRDLLLNLLQSLLP